MEDKHINLKDFLQGNREAPLVWTQMNLDSSPTDKEWIYIEYFKIRAREFLLNIEDLKLPGIHSLTVDTSKTKASANSNIFPNRHRAKSVYLDFRHFIAEDEPSKYELIINTVNRYIKKDNIMHVFLKELKASFLTYQNHNLKLNGKNITAADIINIWFNTEFFHTGYTNQKEDRIKLLDILEHEGNQNVLFWCIINTQHSIKILYACVKDLEKNESIYINCPDSRLLKSPSSKD